MYSSKLVGHAGTYLSNQKVATGNIRINWNPFSVHEK
jgi:hypothetical protein